MILDGILRCGAHFKGISVISELPTLELLSCSVAEISAEEETFVESFLFSTTLVSVHKNDRISDALPTDISATEILSITKYC